MVKQQCKGGHCIDGVYVILWTKQPYDLIMSNKVFSNQDNNHLPTENNLVYMMG